MEHKPAAAPAAHEAGLPDWRGPGGLPLPSRPSIAVLPFANLSGDPAESYFSDGITEEIITELSRFRQLFVIARNSSFQYRGADGGLTQVAAELGVQFVVEGSVRRGEGRAQLTVQLIDAINAAHLWAERYDRDLNDIFAVQDEVVRAIVATIAGRQSADAARHAKRRHTGSLAAYDCLLRGWDQLTRYEGDFAVEARRMFKAAIRIDPDFAAAHAGLAYATISHQFLGIDAASLRTALAAAERAVALDGNDSWCHAALAYVCLFARRHERAERHGAIAAELNPNDADLRAELALQQTYLGRAEPALELLELAQRLNPLHPGWYWNVQGLVLYCLKRYADAAVAYRKLRTSQPWDDCIVAACLAQLGDRAAARTRLDTALKANPALSVGYFAGIEPFKRPADLAHLLDGLRQAGLQE
jgi:adenylate cyclase